jgi:hypothetical protein
MQKGATIDYTKLVPLAEALASKRNWSEMALASTPITELMNSLKAETAQRIEDETYMRNALNDLKLAKALDQMDFAHYAFKHALKAYRTVETLCNLRKEQNSNEQYQVL